MADIICLGEDIELHALTAFALGTLLFPIEDKPTFKTAYIVLHGTESAATTVKEHALKILLDLSLISKSEEAAGLLNLALKFHHPASYEAEELLNYLRTVPPNSTVIVHNAAGYRSGTDPGENTEDEWVQQISRLVHSINDSSTNQHLYIQLLTGRLAPRSQEHIDALFALPGSVFGKGRASKQTLATEQALREWVALSKAGQLEHVLSEIDKSQINIQAQAITRALCLRAYPKTQAIPMP
jgi:hypothetical protein